MSQLPVQALSLVGSGIICDNIPGLISRQRRLCRAHPDVMLSVVRGAKLGVRECQKQFKNHRWNCSTSTRDSTVFGKVMLKGKKYVMMTSLPGKALLINGPLWGESTTDRWFPPQKQWCGVLLFEQTVEQTYCNVYTYPIYEQVIRIKYMSKVSAPEVSANQRCHQSNIKFSLIVTVLKWLQISKPALGFHKWGNMDIFDKKYVKRYVYHAWPITPLSWWTNTSE